MTLVALLAAQAAYYFSPYAQGGLGDVLYLAGAALSLSLFLWLMLDAAIVPGAGPGTAFLLMFYGLLIGFGMMGLPAPPLPAVDAVAGMGLWTPVERLAWWAHVAGPPVIITLAVVVGVARTLTGLYKS